VCRRQDVIEMIQVEGLVVFQVVHGGRSSFPPAANTRKHFGIADA